MKLLALSHTIFISCVYSPNRGEGNQHQHLNWPLDGTQPHGVALVRVLRRSVVCWAARCQESLTSPITWTHRALNRLLGNVQPLLRRPGLPSNSTMQVINIRIVSVTTSRKEHERDHERDYFESNRWHFFESIRFIC